MAGDVKHFRQNKTPQPLLRGVMGLTGLVRRKIACGSPARIRFDWPGIRWSRPVFRNNTGSGNDNLRYNRIVSSFWGLD
jgi:hypothetical protein